MMGRRFSRALKRDQRGAAIIELAIAAPVLAVFLVGMVDLGRGFASKLDLEQASQRAIEKVMNGQADTTVAAALQTEAATTAGVPVSQVTVDYWLECDGVRQASYTSSCSAGQVYRRYMSVSIWKSFSPMFATQWAGANPDGTYTITGKTGVRIQ